MFVIEPDFKVNITIYGNQTNLRKSILNLFPLYKKLQSKFRRFLQENSGKNG